MFVNATHNRDLIEMFIPNPRRQFSHPTEVKMFFHSKVIDFLAVLLTCVSEHRVAGKAKLKVIAAWINSSDTAHGKSCDRSYFFDLPFCIFEPVN